MSYNPFDPANFEDYAPCMPCCTPPTECACALFVGSKMSISPPGPFSSYANAVAGLSGLVADCMVWADSGSFTAPSVFTANTSTPNTLAIAFTPASTASGPIWFSFTVSSGDSLTPSWTGLTVASGSSSVEVSIYDCDGNFIYYDEALGVSGSGALSAFVAPADGTYMARVDTINFDDVNYSFANNDVMVINPVIALWDDSGTTRQLEACPKLYLPLLTESSGTWYASCSDARDAIDLHASNCVGYSEQAASGSFVATDGGTSLTLEDQGTSGPSYGLALWGSVNAVAGETLSISFGTTNLTYNAVSIYDQSGVLVETLTGLSSPLVSSALPYTERYTVKCESLYSASTLNTYVITSSGTLSVNQIQALYDVGLDCPGRLNCGDSC